MPGAFSEAAVLTCDAFLFAGFLLAVALAAWRLSRPLPESLDRALGMLVWSAALVIGATNVLSFFHALTAVGLLAASLAGAALAWWVRSRPQAGDRVPERDPVVVGAVLIPALFVTLFLVLAVLTPDIDWDALAYHLPRLGFWKQLRAVEPFLANNPRVGFFPVNGNILQLPPVLFLSSDRLSPLVQLAAGAGTALVVAGLSLQLGVSGRPAALAGFLWLTVPAVLTQIVTSRVDLVIAFFLASTIFFYERHVRTPALGLLSTALASAAVAVGTKPQGSFAAVVVGLLLVRRLFRQDRCFLAKGVLVGVVLLALVAAPFYVEMLLRMGGLSGLDGLAYLHVHPGLASFAKNLELALAPLLMWKFRTAAGARPEVPFGSLWEALAGDAYSLGFLWLAAFLVALALFLFGLARRRRLFWQPAYLPLLLGGLSALVTLFVMRHQPSVTRFLLPSVALLTPLVALALERLDARPVASLLAASVLLLAGSFVLAENFVSAASGRFLVRATTRSVWDVEPRPEVWRYPPDAWSFSAALDDISKKRGPLRIGVLSGGNCLERLFFGSAYEHTVVPLAYAPPQSPGDLADLDALWVGSWPEKRGFQMGLFRHQVSSASAPGPESYGVTDFHGFDRDFSNAIVDSLWIYDASKVANLLSFQTNWYKAVVTDDAILFVKYGRARSR